MTTIADSSQSEQAEEQHQQLLRSAIETQQQLEQERDRLLRMQEQLRRAASYDPLTGLPNRVAFAEQLVRALAERAVSGRMLAVVFLDLDGFKLVNDSFGHGAGDLLLNAVAFRLSEGIHPMDTVARFGGDEFTILLHAVDSPVDAVEAANALLKRLSEPFRVNGALQFVSASAGIALSSPEEGAGQAEALVRDADIALYQAKAAGRRRALLYSPEMSLQARTRTMIEADLHYAVRKEQLHLHYQPIVDLRTGRTSGVEALVRWQHPELGLIAPEQFIPFAEETHLIYAIDQWVLEEACRQQQQWQRTRAAAPPLTVSVNISSQHLRGTDLFDRVIDAMHRYDLRPGCLELEVTESAMVRDATIAARMMQALKATGVRLAIDDFGVGYSSLSYLKDLPVDALKIDRSFVAALGEGPRASAVVQGVNSLAHSLGLTTTAEGVETQEQADLLRDLGCDYGQGFYWSRPALGEDVFL